MYGLNLDPGLAGSTEPFPIQIPTLPLPMKTTPIEAGGNSLYVCTIGEAELVLGREKDGQDEAARHPLLLQLQRPATLTAPFRGYEIGKLKRVFLTPISWNVFNQCW